MREYVRQAAAKKTEERAAAEEKTGVFTGLHAVNPVNGERIPIYVADYVLTDYGTGAIMAVPAHDQRDFDFARAFDLPIRQVVRPADGEVDESERVRRAHRGRGARQLGRVRRAAGARGRPADRRAAREREGRGRFAVNFRLRDWGFSRQRYWGCPIPVVYCDALRDRPGAGERAAGRAARDRGLQAEGRPPLAQAEDWVNVAVPVAAAGPAQRETETMDTFVDSSWYFLRYCDPHNDEAPFDRARSSTTGTRSTSTSAASTTRRCT